MKDPKLVSIKEFNEKLLSNDKTALSILELLKQSAETGKRRVEKIKKKEFYKSSEEWRKKNPQGIVPDSEDNQPTRRDSEDSRWD